MKIRIEQKPKTIYELDQEDVQVIKSCLNYIYHRQKAHDKGITGELEIIKIKQLRQQFGIIK